LMAGMRRSPLGPTLINPGREGDSRNRQAGKPPGRSADFSPSSWVLPAFLPAVTWNGKVFGCRGKYAEASRMVSLGRAAPTTAGPSLAAITCRSSGGSGSTTPCACAGTAQRAMASERTASSINERGRLGIAMANAAAGLRTSWPRFWEAWALLHTDLLRGCLRSAGGRRVIHLACQPVYRVSIRPAMGLWSYGRVSADGATPASNASDRFQTAE